jgi:hypothetical protein
MTAKGIFEVIMTGEPPYDVVEGVSVGRASSEKTFRGQLEAKSRVAMLGARTPTDGSAGYVAMERITGVLGGKRGTFVVVHTGLMDRGTPSLAIAIVPDSGTGELAGISGRMEIQVVDGTHAYQIEYDFRPE